MRYDYFSSTELSLAHQFDSALIFVIRKGTYLSYVPNH